MPWKVERKGVDGFSISSEWMFGFPRSCLVEWKERRKEGNGLNSFFFFKYSLMFCRNLTNNWGTRRSPPSFCQWMRRIVFLGFLDFFSHSIPYILSSLPPNKGTCFFARLSTIPHINNLEFGFDLTICNSRLKFMVISFKTANRYLTFFSTGFFEGRYCYRSTC